MVLQADVEALAWTPSAPGRQLWASVTVPAVVLTGTETSPFMVDAADSPIRSQPHAEHTEPSGRGHPWRAADLADRLAGYLGVSDRDGAAGGRRSS